MSDDPRSLDEVVRTLQIVVGAMTFGIIVFTGVAVFVAQSMTPNTSLGSMLLPVLGLFAVGEFGAWMVLRQSLIRAARQSLEACPPDERWMKLAAHLRVSHLIPAAMAEGTGLFGVVVYMISGAMAALLAPGLAAVLLVVFFPTRDRIEQAVARLER